MIIEHCPINTLNDVCYYARLMAYRENQLGLIGYICRSRSRAFSDTSHKYERAYTQRYGELENIMDAQYAQNSFAFPLFCREQSLRSLQPASWERIVLIGN